MRVVSPSPFTSIELTTRLYYCCLSTLGLSSRNFDQAREMAGYYFAEYKQLFKTF